MSLLISYIGCNPNITSNTCFIFNISYGIETLNLYAKTILTISTLNPLWSDNTSMPLLPFWTSWTLIDLFEYLDKALSDEELATLAENFMMYDKVSGGKANAGMR